MAAVCAASMAACGGSKTPDPAEVEQAIEEGNVTVKDALEKGWVTQEWADAYLDKNSIPAADKMAANAVGEFTAETVSGEEYTRDQITGATFFAFLDPEDENAEEYFQGLKDAYDSVKEKGAEILVCIKKEDGTELFQDAPFPVIIYNDSVKDAVKNNIEMIEGIPNTGSWYIEGAFLSAWYGKIDAESLADAAEGFVKILNEKNSGTGGEDESNEGNSSTGGVTDGQNGENGGSGAKDGESEEGTSAHTVMG